MEIRAGDLRQRITIKGVVETDDGHHGFIKTPTTVVSRIPARVRTLTGRELERAQQIDPRATRDVLIRKRAGVQAGQTVVFHDPDTGDRELEIVAPPQDPEQSREMWVLLCREAAAA